MTRLPLIDWDALLPRPRSAPLPIHGRCVVDVETNERYV